MLYIKMILMMAEIVISIGSIQYFHFLINKNYDFRYYHYYHPHNLILIKIIAFLCYKLM